MQKNTDNQTKPYYYRVDSSDFDSIYKLDTIKKIIGILTSTFLICFRQNSKIVAFATGLENNIYKKKI
jgi:hypothetical protein